MKKTRILALVLALLLTVSLAACAASTKSADSVSNSASYDESYGYDASAPEAPAAMQEKSTLTTADYKQETEEIYPETEESYSEENSSTEETTTQDAELDSLADKMIYSADLSIQTTEYDAAVAELEYMVESFGGFVEHSDTSGDVRRNDDGTSQVVNRYANYTVRIPASRFKEFLSLTGTLGNVLSKSSYAENVTSQYTDYEARLSSLRTQEERLLSMLEKSDDVDSLIALEERLADVRYETESIERNLRNLDRQIAYSTVSVGLQEVEIYTPTKPVQRTFGEKMRDALSDGWSSFVRSLQYFLIDLTYSLPGLILFVLIVAAAIFVILRVRRRVKAKKAAKKAAAEAAKRPPEQPEEKN